MKHDYSLASSGRSGRPRRPLEIPMTPMIDVIFLLLVFFLATASFQVIEKMLPSSLSELKEQQGTKADTVPEPTQDAVEQVVIELKRVAGVTRVSLNGGQLSNAGELTQRLQAIKLARSDVPVIIDPEGTVPAADVVQAYDMARQVGLARVYLATR